MKTIGYIIGKFYPFHKGHESLIHFACEYPGIDEVVIHIGTQPSEKFQTERHEALSNFIDNEFSFLPVKVYWTTDEMPQYPHEADDFWEQWVNEADKAIGLNEQFRVIVFSSEEYGSEFAKQMVKHNDHVTEARAIPYDIDRSMINTSGTSIRDSIVRNYENISDYMKPYVTQNIILVGPESAGKTTLAKTMGIHYRNATFIPEYARSYLEACGNELSNEKFIDIWNGQYTVEQLWTAKPRTLFNYFDTSLITTVGWWRIYNSDYPLPDFYADDLLKRENVHYVLVSSKNVPYEQDGTRYNPDGRDSSDEFWANLLEEHELPFTRLEASDVHERYREMIVFEQQLIHKIFGE